MRNCSVADCPRPHLARGWCRTHYEYWRRKGIPVYVEPSAADRFWEKVDKSGDCWEWTAARLPRGYGVFSWEQRQGYAHRFSYEQSVGPIPDGLEIDHLCRNPPCVRPDHLEAVTRRENMLRGTSPAAQQARQTHCKRGHVLAGDNVYVWNQERHCRTCRAMRRAA